MSNRSCLANATPELAVFASAVSSIIWATILAMPGSSMSGSDFHYMSAVGSDRTWSIAFAVIAVCQLWRLLGRTQWESFRFAVIADIGIGFASASLWTFVTALCLMNSWPISPYAGTTAVLAFGVWWDFLSYTPSNVRVKKSQGVVESVSSRRVA